MTGTGSEQAERSQRATSFGSAAEDYARYRPAPPADAVEWAVGERRDTVIDLAAGTGNVTKQLVGRVGHLVAIDLDPRMLSVLGPQVPQADRIVARGEALPVRDGAVGGVVVSSAWHWLDAEQVWPELTRVLRPGGSLAVMWSGPDHSVAWVGEVLGRQGWDTKDGSSPPPELGEGGPPASGGGRWNRRHQVEIPDGAPFSEPEVRVFSGSVDYSLADMPGLAASYSRVRVMPAGQRESLLAGVAARAAARAESEGSWSVALPLRCFVWRTLRL